MTTAIETVDYVVAAINAAAIPGLPTCERQLLPDVELKGETSKLFCHLPSNLPEKETRLGVYTKVNTVNVTYRALLKVGDDDDLAAKIDLTEQLRDAIMATANALPNNYVLMTVGQTQPFNYDMAYSEALYQAQMTLEYKGF